MGKESKIIKKFEDFVEVMWGQPIKLDGQDSIYLGSSARNEVLANHFQGQFREDLMFTMRKNSGAEVYLVFAHDPGKKNFSIASRSITKAKNAELFEKYSQMWEKAYSENSTN